MGVKLVQVFADAKCLAKGCPTVTMEVKDIENEKQ